MGATLPHNATSGWPPFPASSVFLAGHSYQEALQIQVGHPVLVQRAGREQAAFNTGFIQNLSFNLIGTQLLTDRGSFVVSTVDDISSETPRNHSFVDEGCIGYGISQGRRWIISDGQNFVWSGLWSIIQ